MRISNPRTLAGDRPLATREYVEVSVSNLSNELYEHISGETKQLSSYVQNVSGNLIGTIGKLSDKVDYNKNLVSSWLTGGGQYSLNNYGYAWLTENGKIDPSLMPPLSLTNVITINQFDILSEISQYNGEGFLPGGITIEAFASFKNKINKQTGTQFSRSI